MPAGIPEQPGGARRARRRLPRQERLRKHADFDRVYKTGRRHFGQHLSVFFLGRDDGQAPRVGFTVSRAMGGAVQRNRIRRRLREAVRLHLEEFRMAADVVINPKKSALKAEFTELERDMVSAFAAVGKKLTARDVKARKGEAE